MGRDTRRCDAIGWTHSPNGRQAHPAPRSWSVTISPACKKNGSARPAEHRGERRDALRAHPRRLGDSEDKLNALLIRRLYPKCSGLAGGTSEGQSSPQEDGEEPPQVTLTDLMNEGEDTEAVKVQKKFLTAQNPCDRMYLESGGTE